MGPRPRQSASPAAPAANPAPRPPRGQAVLWWLAVAYGVLLLWADLGPSTGPLAVLIADWIAYVPMLLLGAAVVWRGPMVQGAITQFLNETVWDEPDVLLIDMPPGTGDAQLAIAQTAAVDGAVIAVTPQDLALDDAKKAMAMFQQTHTPILGLIENMSVFLCPHCGEPSEIFGHGGARAEAEAMGVPFLGEIPLHIELRKRSDEGRPVAFDDGPVAKAFERLAGSVLAACDEARKPLPEIVFS